MLLVPPRSTRTGTLLPSPKLCRSVVGIRTHLGCAPNPHFTPGPQPGLPASWEGGFLCPCHGSMYDLAGRVYKNVPAPDNLEVPPYVFSDDGELLTIGINEKPKA